MITPPENNQGSSYARAWIENENDGPALSKTNQMRTKWEREGVGNSNFRRLPPTLPTGGPEHTSDPTLFAKAHAALQASRRASLDTVGLRNNADSNNHPMTANDGNRDTHIGGQQNVGMKGGPGGGVNYSGIFTAAGSSQLADPSARSFGHLMAGDDQTADSARFPDPSQSKIAHSF